VKKLFILVVLIWAAEYAYLEHKYSHYEGVLQERARLRVDLKAKFSQASEALKPYTRGMLPTKRQHLSH